MRRRKSLGRKQAPKDESAQASGPRTPTGAPRCSRRDTGASQGVDAERQRHQPRYYHEQRELPKCRTSLSTILVTLKTLLGSLEHGVGVSRAKHTVFLYRPKIEFDLGFQSFVTYISSWWGGVGVAVRVIIYGPAWHLQPLEMPASPHPQTTENTATILRVSPGAPLRIPQAADSQA